MKTDIIVLAHNKENEIKNFYDKLITELKGIKYKIIFVDNGSSDDTFKLLKEIQIKDEDNIKIISLSKKHNNNNAVVAALNFSQGDYACIYDFEFPVNYIKKLIENITKNDIDGICLCKRTKEGNFFQKNITKLINKLLNINIINNKTNCRIFNKKMIKAILSLSKDNKIYDDSFDKLGFNIHYEKIKSNMKYKINIPSRFRNIFICMITGLSLIIVSILYLVITLLLTKISFVIMLIFLLLVLSGINLIYMGILNRNIINNINKYEPNYIIKDKYGFDEEVL